MGAAHCIRANTHKQQTSCMCDIHCGVCLSLSLWVVVNVHIICVCFVHMHHFHAVYSIKLLWSACK